MKALFVQNSRLRSGWRVASYFVASRIAILVAQVSFALTLILPMLILGRFFPNLARLDSQIISRSIPVVTALEVVQFALIVLFVFLWRNLIDRRSVRSLGLDNRRVAFSQFMTGVALVALVWLLVFGFSLATSSYTFEGLRSDVPNMATWIVVGALLNLLVGTLEELDARGYILQNLQEGIGFWAAVIVSALLFGAQHLLNPGANAGTLVGTGLFGVLTALAYRATGQLWMPIGMHAAWNYFEGPVLGYLVSGLEMGGLLSLRATGPGWLSGGSFGPEGGVITWLPLIILIVAIYFWARKNPTHSKASEI